MDRKRFLLLVVAAAIILTTSCLFDSDEDVFGIDGYVRDQGGQPVEGVLIRKTGSESGSTYTRSNGYYWLPVNGWSEEVTLAAFRPGWAFCPGLREFKDLGARHHDQDFTGFFGGEVVIDGFVLDSGGNPVEGIKVVNHEPGILVGLTSVTNYLGYYRFGNVIAGYSYKFVPERAGCIFSPSERLYVFPARNYLHQDFVISCIERFGVSGRITDPEGNPVEGVGLLMTPDSVTVVTDENGRYSRTGLDASEGVVVTPSRDGCSFDPASKSIYAPFGDVRDVDFTAWCGQTHTLGGHVRYASGSPVPDLTVRIEGGRFVPSGSDRTDENGYYEFTGVNAGQDYVISPTRIGFAVEPDSIVLEGLEEDRLDLDFEFSEDLMSFRVGGYVRDKEGLPLEGFDPGFYLRPPMMGEAGHTAAETASSLLGSVTDEDGYYSFNVPVGWTIRIYFLREGCLFIPSHHDYTVRGDSQDLDFVAYCGDGYVLSGYVSDTQGAPVYNVPVIAEGGLWYTQTAYTDTAGHYEFTNQPTDLEIRVRPRPDYWILYEGCIPCPQERVYDSLEKDYPDQNFTLSCPWP